jgi:hypothetical protein
VNRTPGQDKHRSTTLITTLLLHARVHKPKHFQTPFFVFLVPSLLPCITLWRRKRKQHATLVISAGSSQLAHGWLLRAGTRLAAAPPPLRLPKQVNLDHVALWPRLRGGRDKLQASALAAVYPMPLPIPTLLSLDLLSPYLLGRAR